MPNRKFVWLALAAIALAGSSLGTGIWLGRQQGHADRQLVKQPAADRQQNPARAELARQATALLMQLELGQASEVDQQRLLELLIGLDRKREATVVLERLADQQPQRWGLRLLLAELRRDQNDRTGALREVRQLRNLKPDQIEPLQLLALLHLELGQRAEALEQVRAVHGRQSKPILKPTALATGLLLSELLLKQGQPGQAEAVLVKLAGDFPADQRPLLARALLHQQRGDLHGAQARLNEAQMLRPGNPDPRIDQVAAAWGLASLRGPSPRPTATSTQGPAANSAP